MKISAIALKAVSYLIGTFSNSSGAKTAKSEFSDALWNWIRPIFIKDDEPLKDLEANSQNEINQAEVALKIDKYLSKNEGEIAKLTELLTLLESKNLPKSNISVSQIHSGSGDNIAGNKIVN